MLTYLKITNLALVDSLSWEPQAGFTAITGETGAGKSVIIGAIKLALGQRADKAIIRSGEQHASVETVFSIPPQSPVHTRLESHGIPPCEDGILMIRRTISASSTRQFINDSPCTLTLLRDVGDHLVDMHSPDDHRSLLSLDRQLALLDAYGEHEDLTAAYAKAWQTLQHARQAYAELSEAEAATEREVELLRHQVEEISSADFTSEEVISLEERWARSRNHARLHEVSAKMLGLLSQSSSGLSLADQFNEFARSSHELERLDPTTEPWMTSIRIIDAELKELEAQLSSYLDHLDCDPKEQAALENRINTLESLKRKYGSQIDDILSTLAAASARLDQIEHRSEKLTELHTLMAQAQQEAEQIATQLTIARKRCAPRLAKEIIRHSRELGFKQAGFDIALQPEPSLTPHGTEAAEFFFAPNPGEPAKPLNLIASSGELARIMLAMKSALAKQDDTPLLIFDEIDSNVGGEVARAVGAKMLDLGEKHQVISITHFPQVAAMASHHYLVQKALVKDRSISRIINIQGEARAAELVRMLGGGGAEAKAHALKLLEQHDELTLL